MVLQAPTTILLRPDSRTIGPSILRTRNPQNRITSRQQISRTSPPPMILFNFHQLPIPRSLISSHASCYSPHRLPSLHSSHSSGWQGTSGCSASAPAHQTRTRPPFPLGSSCTSLSLLLYCSVPVYSICLPAGGDAAVVPTIPSKLIYSRCSRCYASQYHQRWYWFSNWKQGTSVPWR